MTFTAFQCPPFYLDAQTARDASDTHTWQTTIILITGKTWQPQIWASCTLKWCRYWDQPWYLCFQQYYCYREHCGKVVSRVFASGVKDLCTKICCDCKTLCSPCSKWVSNFHQGYGSIGRGASSFTCRAHWNNWCNSKSRSLPLQCTDFETDYYHINSLQFFLRSNLSQT